MGREGLASDGIAPYRPPIVWYRCGDSFVKAAVLALSALLIATPVFAQAGAAPGGGVGGFSQPQNVPEGSAEPGTNGNGERRICRRIDDTTSRMGSRRVCKTAREWRDYERSF